MFRAQYNGITLGLTDFSGPLSTGAIHGFLDGVQPVVRDALAADPYAGVGDVDALFDGLRATVSACVASVRAQASANTPAPRP